MKSLGGRPIGSESWGFGREGPGVDMIGDVGMDMGRDGVEMWGEVWRLRLSVWPILYIDSEEALMKLMKPYVLYVFFRG